MENKHSGVVKRKYIIKLLLNILFFHFLLFERLAVVVEKKKKLEACASEGLFVFYLMSCY